MILVTGHKGYIGSRLFGFLKYKGFYTIGIDRIDKSVRNGEINDIGLDDGLHNFPIHTVYHLAAQAGVTESWRDPYQDALDNILATIRICKTFPDAKLIFTTSGAALEPESPYGLSKKTAEEYIKMLHENYVIVRLSSVYGEKPKGVVDTFIREEKCTVYGDGSAVRDFTHVEDVVKGLIKASELPTGVYQMGSGKPTSVKELAEATGKDIEYKEARKGEKQEVVLQNQIPGWEPRIDVLDYIQEKCKT